ncbi:hypothetical protein GCM10025794_34710 [Massilia kyonggiensis]
MLFIASLSKRFVDPRARFAKPTRERESARRAEQSYKKKDKQN